MLLANKVDRAALLNSHPLPAQLGELIAAPLKRLVFVTQALQQDGGVALRNVFNLRKTRKGVYVHNSPHVPQFITGLTKGNIVNSGLNFGVNIHINLSAAQVKAA